MYHRKDIYTVLNWNNEQNMKCFYNIDSKHSKQNTEYCILIVKFKLFIECVLAIHDQFMLTLKIADLGWKGSFFWK